MSPDERSTPRPSASGAADRIATIIEAAERAAASVVDNADANARRYLEEAQAEADRIVAARLASLSALTDSLVAQAEEIRRRSERLLDALSQVTVQAQPAPAEPPQGTHLTAVAPPAEPPVATPIDFSPPPPAPTAEPAPPVEAAPAPEPRPAPPPAAAAPEPEPPAPAAAPPPPPPDDQAAASAGARLLATQMAVSGSSREEIETRLRTGFEIEDTAPILDAILGPEA